MIERRRLYSAVIGTAFMILALNVIMSIALYISFMAFLLQEPATITVGQYSVSPWTSEGYMERPAPTFFQGSVVNTVNEGIRGYGARNFVREVADRMHVQIHNSRENGRFPIFLYLLQELGYCVGQLLLWFMRFVFWVDPFGSPIRATLFLGGLLGLAYLGSEGKKPTDPGERPGLLPIIGKTLLCVPALWVFFWVLKLVDSYVLVHIVGFLFTKGADMIVTDASSYFLTEIVYFLMLVLGLLYGIVLGIIAMAVHAANHITILLVLATMIMMAWGNGEGDSQPAYSG
jgi:hypothetical protein